MKNFRKPYFAIFFSFLILLVSCSKDNTDLIENKMVESSSLDEIQLESIHKNIKLELKRANENLQIKSSTFENSSVEKKFIQNLKYVNENGLESLYSQFKINNKFLAQLEFYQDNKSKENRYQLLMDNFRINNIEEANFLFNLIEVYHLVENELKNNRNFQLSKDQIKGISWGCALAIAGTISVTAGAAFVTGGASLVVFLVSKGIATAAIIEACS
ncbi:hypothetical protein LB467_18530 [Salegentibacter sp. JZCK2]|uniref:hypothetical protein n=1 Tax=Salegentibacter tibetensis TaxID=2873600 RepID=UPI001CCD154A|nr:hypothetical protein [Salegentibacter tibetensis]MBZ9731684.1 hypothetical protein [Salegentibacter tibetensis]